MSTNIKELDDLDGKMLLTQFSGGEKNGLSLQITGSNHQYVQMTAWQAMRLSNAIFLWYIEFLEKERKSEQP